jgi:hypothetical protein
MIIAGVEMAGAAFGVAAAEESGVGNMPAGVYTVRSRNAGVRNRAPVVALKRY